MSESTNPAPLVLALLGASTLILSACEVGPKVPDGPPPQPKVRKLYAPSSPEPETPRVDAVDPRSDADPTDEAERAALAAALLGQEEPEPQPEVEPERKPRRRAARRRAAPVEDDPPLFEEDPGPGRLSDGAFQSAITDWSGMKRCLASNAARMPTSSGALRVAFTIRGDGQVARSRVVETSNDVARAIAPCVERRARRIRFPSFAEVSDEIEKTAKFVF